VTADSALAAARALFDAGRRVEMGPLAESLGVNRATLYRWVGSRDALLGALVRERIDRGLAAADARARRAGRTGTARLAVLLTALFAGAGRTSPVRAFVDSEPAAAMRVMTTGPVHDRLIERFAGLIDDEAAAGSLAPRYPSRQIAELIVKTGEAVFWFDVTSGRGLDQANMLVLLDALCSPTSSPIDRSPTS
jgi:AcrR family transcriptional regulator